MYSILIFIAVFVLFTVWVLNFPIFGRVPEGARLARIKKLPNYRDGALENLSPTPMKPDNVSYWDMIKGMLRGNVNGAPKSPVPTIKPDFTQDASETKITWFGHSSYLVQTDGQNILVDPVLSERPSPFSFIGTKRFLGTDFLKAEEFPELDIVLITHDHYDHLDYEAILKLKDKTNRFIVSLGVGSHLEKWGVPASRITEMSWGEEIVFNTLKFTALPARHFTGRKFKRNQTVWSAFVLQTSKDKLYLGGDSGYDTHFKDAWRAIWTL
ncbi:MBL fold metallo-hydrolase [Pedobacter panaciterrae]